MWAVELFFDKPNFLMVFQSIITYKYTRNRKLPYSNIIFTLPHQIVFEIAKAIC